MKWIKNGEKDQAKQRMGEDNMAKERKTKQDRE